MIKTRLSYPIYTPFVNIIQEMQGRLAVGAAAKLLVATEISDGSGSGSNDDAVAGCEEALTESDILSGVAECCFCCVP